MSKLRVGVLYGGKSAEHEVSLQSGQNVIDALDRDTYDVMPIKIEKDGSWDQSMLQQVNVIFPVLHGTYGEDGTMQGLLELAGVPYVGCDVLSSAVCMDKDVAKRLLRAADIPVVDWITITQSERQAITFEDIQQKLGMPVFVKPVNLGSSVGIHKVNTPQVLQHALDDAFSYDTKILIERFVDGRELNCAILGNDKPKASPIGEIITSRDFYDYYAKYLDESDTRIEAPASISDAVVQSMQAYAILAFQTLGCSGLARVEGFVTSNDKVIISEVNTIPGFTSHSIYPHLWEKAGLTQTELVGTLVDLALQRAETRKQLKTTYEAKE